MKNAPAAKTTAVVGTFDSRAIAIACASSGWNEKYLEGKQPVPRTQILMMKDDD